MEKNLFKVRHNGLKCYLKEHSYSVYLRVKYLILILLPPYDASGASSNQKKSVKTLSSVPFVLIFHDHLLKMLVEKNIPKFYFKKLVQSIVDVEYIPTYTYFTLTSGTM